MNFNPMDFLKNASAIQARMEEVKKSMESLSVSGYGGGDMVRVDMNGKMEITDVKISPDAIDPADPSMTEQLVKAACTDAYTKMKQKINEEFGNYH
ncbi:MAG: YbaB/EbfC family nucleoid-associated protein [Spirochaetia bacterium]|nr:YbaB/EbfC family nucleoid-associated protein [Spirochaetia bacterium]MBQ3712938.1 YbaB/EbfC family nucleoid-associated protein [Spirochaetia bacterium]MBQ6904642.1 YbaB/EbfC family nucleoid-associated protein [Spirochaetia bacterium]